LIKIRKALAADRDQIHSIFLSTFNSTWKPELSVEGAAHAAGIEERFLNYVNSCWVDFYVAELEGSVIGVAHWYDNFLEALHVVSDKQGNGAGGMLLEKAIASIRTNYQKVRLETDTFNEQARAFYQKHGFLEVDTYPDEEWKSGFTTVLMEKPLK